LDDAQRQVVDELSMQFEQLGLSPIAGRIVAWLLIAPRPDQSSQEIADAIDVSRGSVSTQTQVLQGMGMVERFRRTGSREVYFHLHPQLLLDMLTKQARLAGRMREIVDQVVEEHGATQRLDEFQSINEFIGRRVPELVQEWRQERRKKSLRLLEP
jgi:DNA-binding transcriptional regulator GbsR (MarR family)